MIKAPLCMTCSDGFQTGPKIGSNIAEKTQKLNQKLSKKLDDTLHAENGRAYTLNM